MTPPDTRICVFAGPTIPHSEASRYLNALFLPPAGMGDLFLNYQKHKPKIMALIDGVFLNEPAVWHKEIMWLLSQQVHVYGCSSMGALRAAELHRHGMVGSGMVFNAYVDGFYPGYLDETFEDDDEVAVIHAPSELGFTPVSEAMVNIRSTFNACVRDGIVTAQTAADLVNFSKQQFYQQRSYKAVLQFAESTLALAPQKISELKSWLDDNQINQKSDDAVEMLKSISKLDMNELGRVDPVEFEATDVWKMAVSELRELHEGQGWPDEIASAT